MHIREVIVDGFKSYSQRTVIGPFDKAFNAITGLNGHGKSNILDSICFVLGITNLSQVRVSNLQELIYMQGQAGITEAKVSIIFDNRDKATSPIEYKELDEIEITRKVAIGGKNKYMINGKTVQQQRVQNLFHSVQLNVNNPHFLIMQGRITKVMNMKPAEVLGMLEEAAGTRMYETKKQKALATIEKKQTKINEINTVMTDEINPTLERLRTDKHKFHKYQSNLTEIQRCERFCVAFQHTELTSSASRLEEECKAMVDVLGRLMSEKERIESTLGQINVQVRKMEGNVDRELQAKCKAADDRVNELAKSVVKKNAEYNHALEEAKTAGEAKAKREADEAEIKEAIVKKQEEVTDKEAAAAEAETHLKRKEEGLEVAKADVTACKSGRETSQVQATKTELADAERIHTEKKSESEKLKLQKKHLSEDAKKKRAAAKAGEKDGRSLDKELERAEANVAELEKAMGSTDGSGDAAGEIVDDLRREKEERETTRDDARSRVENIEAKLRANRGLNFDFTDPIRGFDRSRVKGVLCKLFRVKDPKFALALEVTGGGRLYNVVCTDEITATQLLEKGKLKHRVTMVPLNKITAQRLSPQQREAAERLLGPDKDKARPALNLVTFDDDSVEPAIAFAFSQAMVCDDMTTAKKLTFDRTVGVKTVTLDGDSFDPSGTLTGGSRAREDGALSILLTAERAYAALDRAEASLAEASARLNDAESAASKRGRIEGELSVARSEVEGLRRRVESGAHHKAKAALAEAEAALDGVVKALERADQAVADEAARVKDLKAQVKEFEKGAKATVKQMEKRVEELKKEVAAAKKAVVAATDAREKAIAELGDLREELFAVQESLKGDVEVVTKAEAAVNQLGAEQESVKRSYEAEKRGLDDLTTQMAHETSELQELSNRQAQLRQRLDDIEVEDKKSKHALTRKQKDTANTSERLAALAKRHKWIATEVQFFGKPHTDYDFEARDPESEMVRLDRMRQENDALSKTINKRVLSMFEKAEQEYQDLVKRKQIVEQDKAKIQKVIYELDESKKRALETTYEKVNKDFGSIFSTLLPGAQAKLEPPEGMTFLEGLVVRVGFGGQWKESLTELSGGQRSLLALSLVLSLLLFKPAPMYIMDEIDSALDLSHTQNIGRMIKTHFSQSQFVVVSLKEGMFNNANVIFRAQLVGTSSTVKRTANNASAAGRGSGTSIASADNRENVDNVGAVRTAGKRRRNVAS